MIEIIPNWHPIFVHFTVALISMSCIFFIGAKLFVNKKLGEELLTVARWLLWSGGLLTIATIIAGFFAYYSVAHDTPSHVAMTTHRNWALVTAIGIAVCFIWSITHYLRRTKTTIAFVSSMLIVLALLASTAWHGAELVYRYGIGVLSLPKQAESGHAHKHNDSHTEHKQQSDNHNSHENHRH